MLRRTFLTGAAAAPAVALQTLPSGIRLGIDCYSIRALGWKAPKLLEYGIGLKLDAVQFSGLQEFESQDAAYLSKLRERAAQADVTLEVGLGCICATSEGWNKRNGDPVTYLQTGLKVARPLGAKIIKAYLGGSADRTGALPLERHIEETLKTLRAARSMAVDFGVKIAMENHSGDLQAREMRDLVEAAGKDWVGCCYDSGNPMMTLEDPVDVLEMLGPYTITTHIRDSVLFEHPRGAAWQWVSMGDGVVDWQRLLQVYQRHCPKAAFLFEILTGRPPRVVPYLELDFWKAFPKAHASDFARYVALAKRGHPLMGNMAILEGSPQAPPEFKEALKRQQQVDLERSIEFAKTKLGLGINCRS